jgi:hypothetical protein
MAGWVEVFEALVAGDCAQQTLAMSNAVIVTKMNRDWIRVSIVSLLCYSWGGG